METQGEMEIKERDIAGEGDGQRQRVYCTSHLHLSLSSTGHRVKWAILRCFQTHEGKLCENEHKLYREELRSGGSLPLINTDTFISTQEPHCAVVLDCVKMWVYIFLPFVHWKKIVNLLTVYNRRLVDYRGGTSKPHKTWQQKGNWPWHAIACPIMRLEMRLFICCLPRVFGSGAFSALGSESGSEFAVVPLAHLSTPWYPLRQSVQKAKAQGAQKAHVSPGSRTTAELQFGRGQYTTSAMQSSVLCNSSRSYRLNSSSPTSSFTWTERNVLELKTYSIHMYKTFINIIIDSDDYR